MCVATKAMCKPTKAEGLVKVRVRLKRMQAAQKNVTTSPPSGNQTVLGRQKARGGGGGGGGTLEYVNVWNRGKMRVCSGKRYVRGGRGLPVVWGGVMCVPCGMC